MIDILIVDDEKRIRDGIRNNIPWEANGINVCGTASSGMEALDMIDSMMPGIVITDISMSDMDGLELLELINQTYPAVKVILISGYKDFEYAQKAVSLNAYSYLTKPIDSAKLLQKVLDAKADIEKRLSEIRINDAIRKRLRENILVVKDSFFSNLLEGKLRNKKEIEDTAEYLEINFGFNQFLVAVISYEAGQSLKNSNLYDISFFKAAIMSRTEELIKDMYTCYVFNLGAMIGVIVCADRIEKNLLDERFGQIRTWINNNMGLSVTVGVGSICGSIERITLSHRAAEEAMQYRVVLGRNVVIDYDIIRTTTKEKIAMDDFDLILKVNEDRFINAIRNDNKLQIKELLDEVMNSVNQIVRYDIHQKERVIFLLAYYLTKMLFTLEIHSHRYYGNENDLYAAMNDMKGIDEIRTFIREFIEDAIHELEEAKQSNNSFLVSQAIKLIDSNPDGSATLVSVAERLQIHPNYLSKIFKQETNESFSEHLIKNKMNMAKRMLRTTNKKVYEIASDVGYRDVAHFTKVFKKSFGISPSEYRNIM
ncbi:MAG TPA: response regulator [Clostridia bacterium]|nr:response regulator [Clostridia bacterium]